MANFNAGKFWTSITKLQETCILSINIKFFGFVKDFSAGVGTCYFRAHLEKILHDITG